MNIILVLIQGYDAMPDTANAYFFKCRNYMDKKQHIILQFSQISIKYEKFWIIMYYLS